MPAHVIPFPTFRQRFIAMSTTMIKNALIVAAVIAAVMMLNNMTGNRLSTALAA